MERIVEYLDLPQEPPAIIESNRPPAYWPSSAGGVSVENLVLKYSPELEPVLRGVSFEIKVSLPHLFDYFVFLILILV